MTLTNRVQAESAKSVFVVGTATGIIGKTALRQAGAQLEGWRGMKLQSRLFTFAIKDIALVTVIVALWFGWHRDKELIRVESQTRYDALIEKNRELERHNAAVGARADINSNSAVQLMHGIRADLFEVKQILIDPHFKPRR